MISLQAAVDEPRHDDDDHAKFATCNAAIDVQIGFVGNDGFERWKAMHAYFEDVWRGEIAHIDDFDEAGHERFKTMIPVYAEWFGGL